MRECLSKLEELKGTAKDVPLTADLLLDLTATIILSSLQIMSDVGFFTSWVQKQELQKRRGRSL